MNVRPKFRPPLDPDFIPPALWNRRYRAAVRDAGGEPLAIALERSDGPYLFGALTLADLTFVPVIRRLRAHHFPLVRYPRASLWATELMSRPSVQEWMVAAEALPPVGL